MNDLIQAPSIQPLPSPPLLERFLFEQPLLPVVVLAVLAIVAAIAFARLGQRRRGLLVAGVLAVLAGGVYATAFMVTTQRERLLEQTEALIGATATLDSAALQRLLTDDARLPTSGDIARVQPSVDGRDEIIDLAELRLRGQTQISDWRIRDRQATIDGPNVARTLIRVGVDGDTFSRTHYSWWRLDWEKGADGQWRCYTIDPRWIQFVGSAN